MFGKKKTKVVKDSCKCTTKDESNSSTSACHNTKASDMTSGSRSTKSCGTKLASNTTSRKSSSSSATRSCGDKNCK